MLDAVSVDKLIRNKYGSDNIRVIMVDRAEVTVDFYKEKDALDFYDNLQKLENYINGLSLTCHRGFIHKYWRVKVIESRFRIYQKQEEEKWLRMK